MYKPIAKTEPSPTARKLIACPQWEWRPGMLSHFGYRVIGSERRETGALPDLTDAGTAGALLSMLPESGVAHQDWYCGPCVEGYYVWLSCRCTPFDTDDDGSVIGATLGEAVALALLAVWSDE